ncbi:LamG domain-containing protein [Luteolibacter sp. Populi]|uniref:LamG domain-containing protein n=1 Tax=Luteolibacter sp. Populi TaxID=3230487 RepID=UPI0034654C6C
MKEDDEILARILAGDGSEEEIRRLLDDPAAAERLADLAAIDAMLGIAAEDEFTRERGVNETMKFLRAQEQESFVGGVRQRLQTRQNWMRGIGAGAAAAVALFASNWLFFKSTPVATVLRAETVTWEVGRDLSEGEGVRAGARIHFSSGILEMRGAKGSTMIVEGPADIQVLSAGEARLNQGRMVVHTSAKDGHYTVSTARGSVRSDEDYALSVNKGSDLELVAMGADVSLQSADRGKSTAVKKGDTLLLGENATERQDASFYTALPPRSESPAPYVHWAMDEGSGTLSAADSRGMPEGPMDLKLLADAGGGGPAWGEGRIKGGLDFDGKSAFAESGFPGIEGGDPRTVCFWVKAPADLSTKEGFAIVSWGRFDSYNAGGVWQVSLNPLEEEGLVGRVRVGTHLGHLVGSTDLRDGKWHHVAVVLFGGSSPDIGTHVIAYVDGRMEEITRRTLRPIKTDVNANHGVWIGRNITDRPGSPSIAHGRFFRGGVDEVYIFGGALSPKEIRGVMERNEVR